MANVLQVKHNSNHKWYNSYLNRVKELCKEYQKYSNNSNQRNKMIYEFESWKFLVYAHG